MTEEHKKKIGLANSKIMKLKWQDPEYNRRMRMYQTGHSVPKSFVQKCRARMTSNKINLGRTGQKAGNWRGGITPINVLIRSSTKMREWRKAVFERDNFTCQKCSQIGGKLNADHDLPFSLFPDLRFEVLNGQTLCQKCHQKTDTWGNGNMIKKIHMIYD